MHRFADPEYADLTLLMRTGQRPGEVFDAAARRAARSRIHPTEVERLAALTERPTPSQGGMVIADTREQVAALNAAIRDHRLATGETRPAGRSPPQPANDSASATGSPPDATTATSVSPTATAGPSPAPTADGGLLVRGRGGDRTLPADYVREHTSSSPTPPPSTAPKARPSTSAHLLIGETTGAAAAYVGMTRGRHHNTAHLVADTLDDARAQWIEVFSRDRADLGPAHAAQTAAEDIERYGPQATPRGTESDVAPETGLIRRRHLEERAPGSHHQPCQGYRPMTSSDEIRPDLIAEGPSSVLGS